MSRPGPASLHPEQAAALAVANASVALSAGAGCGKTRVLMERYLGALGGARPEPLGRLIALTFTEKAALELRERVRLDCRRRLDRDEAPAASVTGAEAETDAAPTDWRAVLRGLDAAPIGTFHSFCARVLRRFPIEAGLEPDFGVLDATVAGTLRDETIAGVVRDRLLAGDEDLVALAIEVGLPGLQGLLAALVESRTKVDLAAWAARDATAIVAAWEDRLHEEFLPVLLEQNRVLAREVLALLEGNRPRSGPATMQKIEAIRGELRPADGGGDFLAGLARARVHMSFSGMRASQWDDPDGYPRVKDTLGRLREAADVVLSLIAHDPETSLAAAQTGRRLARLGLLTIEAYDRAKRARGEVDFDDQLLRTRDLLRARPEPVARWLERTVGAVLVDEFQDTDPIQADILRLLTGERFAASLFLVGDVKQSIYRFRGARPELFARLRDEFPEAGRKSLRANFRSLPPVLDFVNALFATAFPGEEHRLLSGLDLPPATTDPAVTLVWASETAPGGAKVAVAQRRKVEARWLARLLAVGIESGRWTVRDRRTGAARPAEPGDVAILFRTLNDAAAYEDALVAAGLDYYVVGGAAFFGQQEVLDLINVLSVIEDPLDAVALAATLRGPFGGLSDNGLYWLGTVPKRDLPAAFEHWERLAHLDPQDRRRAGRLHGLLARWRSLKDAMPIADLLDRVLTESGVEAALPAEFLGDRRRANVRKLVRMARVYDAETGFTLGSFIERLRADWRDPPREEQAATTDEHETRAVRLMTIHQSKGLEFPIVVVPDLGRKDQAGRESMAATDDLGVVVSATLAAPDDSGADAEEGEAGREPAAKNLGWILHRHRERLASEEEARRMFYVATTRARDHLILSAGMAPTEKPNSPALRLLAEAFDLGTGACLVPLPDGARTPTLAVVVAPPPEPAGRARRNRPKLLRVAREIDRLTNAGAGATTAGAVLAPPAVPRRPRFIDLDPAIGLGARDARADALLRVLLASPAALDPDPARLAAAVQAGARRLVPAPPVASQRPVREALAAWLETPLGRALRGAKSVRAAVPWTRPLAGDGHEPTVLAGRLDLLLVDPRGRSTLVQLALPGSDPARERVRLIGSARAAIDLGLAREVDHAWLVRLGTPPALQGEEQLDEPALLAALDAYLAAITPEVG
jgi:ATP-dependent helicase/nuclease subunit A